MPHFTTMADNALRDVTSQAFRKHSLDQLRHEHTIVRMDKCQIIVKVWRVLYRIKAVDAKKFMRPVLKGPSGIEDPTANVAETLRFGQIEPVPLQLLSALYQPLLDPLLIINVGTRTIPFEDISTFIEYRNFLVQQPEINPIGSSHPRCFLKRF